MPLSWELVTATLSFRGAVLAWSSCNRFIAISEQESASVDIVDGVTLKKLNTLKCSKSRTKLLSFSPDSHLLTKFSNTELMNWDLQTGGLVSTIPLVNSIGIYSPSSTYSGDGKIIAVASTGYSSTTTISTYNLFSGEHLHSYTLSEGYVMHPIWTHSECIQFATKVPGVIKIWEVGFSSKNMSEVKTLLLPDKLASASLISRPTLSRIVSTYATDILIWDAQNSKVLLEFELESWIETKSFSPDGSSFVCITHYHFLYLWKETPVGYTLHQKAQVIMHSGSMDLLFSPNAESIVMYDGYSVHLLTTGDPIIYPSRNSDRYVHYTDILLKISPDETLAVAQLELKEIIILDLKSGDVRLAIDVHGLFYYLGVAGSKVIVADREGLVALDIPARGSALNARVNIDNCVYTTFDHSPWTPSQYGKILSISPDLNCIAIIQKTTESAGCLSIFNTWTGKCLTSAAAELELNSLPYFTPDGCEVWNVPSRGLVARWTIIKESQSHLINLEPLEPITCPLGIRNLQESPLGDKVTNDGWILSPTQKRLLWLPHHWQLSQRKKVWQGQFFMFLFHDISEYVLLECLE